MNEPIKIATRIKVDNGRFLTEANAHRIVARSLQPTDRMGNRLGKDGKSPLWSLRNDPPYYRVWRIRKEVPDKCFGLGKKRQFIFREVSDGSGICGYAPTVRSLVIKTLSGLFGSRTDITIEVEPDLAGRATVLEAAA